MRNANYLTILFVILLIISCSKHTPDTDVEKKKKNEETEAVRRSPREPCEQNVRQKKEFAERKYKFPSIMVEADDKYTCVNGEERHGLLISLVIKNWNVVHDKYGRMCRYTSPLITYETLHKTLNFNDEDVIYKTSPAPGEPQAYIKTDRLI